MESIRCNDGKIRLMVNDDPDRVIAFDPDDVVFLDKLYGLMGDMEKKKAEFAEAEKELDKETAVDGYGFPVNMRQKLKLLLDICLFFREQIDQIFGAGTSQTVFGDSNRLDMFEQFFAGITPYIQKNREEKLAKYTAVPQRNVMQ